MKNMEILEEFSSCNDQTTVKGKRSKRLRPSSSASSSGGGEFNCNSLISSPTSSSGISTSTEEDEDMANCLILLAGGGSRKNITCTENKFSSRKFAEIAAATKNGKVGIYVYECKTCNRTFPSFQALGGHRASHKKPKPTIDVDLEISTPPRGSVAAPGDEVEQDITPPISKHLPKSKRLNIENKRKIHECSICGSEFASGQALGGHMRRHRSATNSNTTKSANDSSSQDEIGEKSRNMLALDLDLNLPAPLDEGRRDREFHDQFASDQQPYLVFSAAALLDCHY